MTKTPDEINEAVLHCSPVSCRSDGCPYKADTPKYEGDMPVCRMKLWCDMLCLIQQLQAENAKQAEKIKQFEAERDAAVKDIRLAFTMHLGACNTCLYFEDRLACDAANICALCEDKECVCNNCDNDCSNWKWRGVQKEAPSC